MGSIAVNDEGLPVIKHTRIWAPWDKDRSLASVLFSTADNETLHWWEVCWVQNYWMDWYPQPSKWNGLSLYISNHVQQESASVQALGKREKYIHFL